MIRWTEYDYAANKGRQYWARLVAPKDGTGLIDLFKIN